MTADEKEVEMKVEQIEENPISVIEDQIDDQVELPSDPSEPEKEAVQEERTPEEKADFEEFVKEMKEITNEATPEVEASLDPTDGLCPTNSSNEIGGYNPEAETGKNKVIDAAVAASTPVTALVVEDKIIDAADDILSAQPEEYDHSSDTLLDNHEEEDVIQLVDTVEIISADGPENGDVKVMSEDGESVATVTGIESDSEEITDIVEDIEDEINPDEEQNFETVTNGDLDPIEDNRDDFSENATVGQIEVSNITVVSNDGYESKDVDIVIPSVSETPLDDVEGYDKEIIHVGTIDTENLDADIDKQVGIMLGGTESEDTKLSLQLSSDDFHITEKGSDSDVIYGSGADVMMAVAGTAYDSEVLPEDLEEAGLVKGDATYDEVEIDQSNKMSEYDDIIGSGDDDDYHDEFDDFINKEDYEVITSESGEELE